MTALRVFFDFVSQASLQLNLIVMTPENLSGSWGGFVIAEPADRKLRGPDRGPVLCRDQADRV